MKLVRNLFAIPITAGSFAAAADPAPPCHAANPPRPPSTIAGAIAGAEKSGALPVLNRDDTLAGPDVDGNGIRDDIDVWIATLPDTEVQKAALRQSARSVQASLLVNTVARTDLDAVEHARPGPR